MNDKKGKCSENSRSQQQKKIPKQRITNSTKEIIGTKV
jgi:hypothetical protein